MLQSLVIKTLESNKIIKRTMQSNFISCKMWKHFKHHSYTLCKLKWKSHQWKYDWIKNARTMQLK